MSRLRDFRVAGIALVIALSLAGCRGKKGTAPEATGNPLKPDPAGGHVVQNEFQRPGQRVVNQDLMKNFGVYYVAYRSEKDGVPRSVAEFKTYLQEDPNARNLVAAIDKDWIVFVLDPPPSGHQVLAYEKDVYQKFNNHLVLFADGAVEMMEDADFQKALKGK
jgi:hypothetical protein